MCDIAWLQPVEVKAMLKGPDRDKVLVLDVREDDYYGGHIKGCIHMPVQEFGSDHTIDDFIEERLRCGELETVVVHCYLSQQRGPLCARRLASRMREQGLRQPQVCIMAFGFKRFNQLFGDDPDLVESDGEEAAAAAEAITNCWGDSGSHAGY